MKKELAERKPIDLGKYGIFLPKAVEFNAGDNKVIIFGEYTPLTDGGEYGKTIETEIVAFLDRPMEDDPEAIYEAGWVQWEIMA